MVEWLVCYVLQCWPEECMLYISRDHACFCLRWSTTRTRRGSVWVSSRAPSTLEHVKGTAWRWRRTMCTPGSNLPRSPPSYMQRATTSMPPYSRRASNRVEAIPEREGTSIVCGTMSHNIVFSRQVLRSYSTLSMQRTQCAGI